MQVYAPCLEDREGRLVMVVGPLGEWTPTLQFLERHHRARLLACRAVPQPADHPGLVR